MSTKVYLVYASKGWFDDCEEWIEAAYFNEKDAIEYKNKYDSNTEKDRRLYHEAEIKAIEVL